MAQAVADAADKLFLEHINTLIHLGTPEQLQTALELWSRARALSSHCKLEEQLCRSIVAGRTDAVRVLVEHGAGLIVNGNMRNRRDVRPCSTSSGLCLAMELLFRWPTQREHAKECLRLFAKHYHDVLKEGFECCLATHLKSEGDLWAFDFLIEHLGLDLRALQPVGIKLWNDQIATDMLPPAWVYALVERLFAAAAVTGKDLIGAGCRYPPCSCWNRYRFLVTRLLFPMRHGLEFGFFFAMPSSELDWNAQEDAERQGVGRAVGYIEDDGEAYELIRVDNLICKKATPVCAAVMLGVPEYVRQRLRQACGADPVALGCLLREARLLAKQEAETLADNPQYLDGEVIAVADNDDDKARIKYEGRDRQGVVALLERAVSPSVRVRGPLLPLIVRLRIRALLLVHQRLCAKHNGLTLPMELWDLVFDLLDDTRSASRTVSFRSA